MNYTINIINVDEDAKLDIDYFINKYLKKIEGIYDTNIGNGTINKNVEMNFVIKRN